MTTEEQTGILQEKDQIAEESRFQEQCFLMEFLDTFYIQNKNTTYPNFVQLNGAPATILNKLLAPGVEGLFKITPAQKALLVPKIRLFKTFYTLDGKEKDVELYFDDFVDTQNTNSILLNHSAVGLKKFEWEDMGTNPGDSGKAFKTTLTLFFKRFTDIFEERVDENGFVVSFADLIRVPPDRYLLNGLQNDKFFRIKVQIGWAVPPKTDLINDELYEAVENSTTTLFLNLVFHEIKVEQNGNVSIIIQYIGAIETKLLSPEMDVLDPGEIAEKEIKLIENLVKQTKDRLQEQQQKIEREENTETTGFIEKASKLRRWVDKASNFITGKDGFSFIKNDDELVKEHLEEDVENYLKQKEDLLRKNRIQAYQKLLSSLEKDNRLFYVDVPKDQIELFGTLRKTNQLSRDLASKERVKRIQEYRETRKSVKTQTNTFNIGLENSVQKLNLSNDIVSITSTTDPEEREEKINASLSGKTKSDSPKDRNQIRINYIFLGDVINAGLNVVFNDSRLPNQYKESRRDLFRFLVGPIEYFDPITQTTKVISLADIPISLDLFQAWFVKKVIRPQLDKYLLRDFLRDLCSELVLNALSPECFGNTTKNVRNRISFSVFSLPVANKDPLCPSISSGVFGNIRVNIDSISIEELKNLRRNQQNIQDFKHYFFIYVSGIAPTTLNGDYEKDVANGIYHFNIGADVGLFKRIEFSRADVQYLKEARITNAENSRRGELFLSEPYNAKLTLLGNSIFKPGMNVYVDPASIGMGLDIPKNKRLPIGGYYSIVKVSGFIEPGQFEVALELNWETDGGSSINQLNTGFSGFPDKPIDAI